MCATGKIQSRRSTGCGELARFGKRNRGTGLGGWDAPVSATQEQSRTVIGTQQEIIERLELIEQQAGEYQRRSAHAESVIDRLHAENQELRDNARSSVFEPVAADLIRLYDSLSQEADRLAGAEAAPAVAKLMMSFADDVELTLDRCGFEPVGAAAGDPFIVGQHAAVGVDATDDESLNNTVARVVATGLRDKATGVVRRPLKARVYRTSGSKGQDIPGSDQGEPHDDDLRD
jgi:molecular chaperone GrpE (heat shock protein)